MDLCLTRLGDVGAGARMECGARRSWNSPYIVVAPFGLASLLSTPIPPQPPYLIIHMSASDNELEAEIAAVQARLKEMERLRAEKKAEAERLAREAEEKRKREEAEAKEREERLRSERAEREKAAEERAKKARDEKESEAGTSKVSKDLLTGEPGLITSQDTPMEINSEDEAGTTRPQKRKRRASVAAWKACERCEARGILCEPPVMGSKGSACQACARGHITCKKAGGSRKGDEDDEVEVEEGSARSSQPRKRMRAEVLVPPAGYNTGATERALLEVAKQMAGSLASLAKDVAGLREEVGELRKDRKEMEKEKKKEKKETEVQTEETEKEEKETEKEDKETETGGERDAEGDVE